MHMTEPMHRNNRAAFLLRQIEYEALTQSTRAIAPYCASLNHFFGVLPGSGQSSRRSRVLCAYL